MPRTATGKVVRDHAVLRATATLNELSHPAAPRPGQNAENTKGASNGG